MNPYMMGGLSALGTLPQQPRPQTATFTFTVGRLLARSARDFLAQTKFKGYQINYLESSGWLDRTFVVKGNVDAVRYVQASLEQWARRMDEATEASKAKP